MRIRPRLVLVSLSGLIALELLGAGTGSRHPGIAAAEAASSAAPDAEVPPESVGAVDEPRRARDEARPRVGIRVYNSTDLANATQHLWLGMAATALSRAALEIQWKICASACDTPIEPTDLLVRMIQAPAGDRGNDSRLGYALIDSQMRTGLMATIYVDRTLRLARELRIDHTALLARVIAHEIGHLLLASNRHGRSGLMREIWAADELLAARNDDWVLHPRDAAEIRDRLAQSASQLRRGAS